MIRKLVRAPVVPGLLPKGPGPKPGSFSAVTHHAEQGNLQLATTLWYEMARGEWSSFAGASPTYRAATLKWAPA
eukprot:5690812-Karenia_brevis.AAC.1